MNTLLNLFPDVVFKHSSSPGGIEEFKSDHMSLSFYPNEFIS